MVQEKHDLSTGGTAMTPEQEKRLLEIFDRCFCALPAEISSERIIKEDIPWLIALAREKDDKLHGKGGGT